MTPGTNSPVPVDSREMRRLRAADAIQRAVRVAGGDFGYLMKTAGRESGYSTSARNPRSSATGMFQFIEQTWLATMKKHGDDHGLSSFADAIQRDKSGRYYVADAGMRRQILDLRSDPHVAAVMAAEHSGDNARYMRQRLGREPHPGELYAAHFLGMRGAVKLIRAVEDSPSTSAARVFPSAAGANGSMFYTKGRALTVAQLYQNLTKDRGGDPIAPVDDSTRLYLAQAGGGSSRRGVDVLPQNPAGSVRVATAEAERSMNAQLASILSPTLAQILLDEDSPFRKSFG